MTWILEGEGFYYEFSEWFDLRSYDRETNVPLQVVQGKDGAVSDIRANQQRPTQHVLGGLVQGSSVEDALAQFDAIAGTATGKVSELYLTDSESNRTVKVQHLSTRASRDPAKIITIQIAFTTTDIPYWQDKSLTTVSNNDEYQDLALGTAESVGQTYVAGSVTNPVLVRGNWSLVSHIADKKAMAATTSSPYWGEITATESGTVIRPSRYGFGRLIETADSFQFASLAQRKDKMSFIIQIRGATAWTGSTTFTLFDFNSTRLTLKLDSGDWVFGHGSSTISGSASAYTAGKDYQIAGSYDDNEASLYENGKQIATGTISEPSNALSTLNIGGGGQIIDAIYLFNNAIGEDVIRGFAANQTASNADNEVFKFNTAVPSDEYLLINHDNRTVELWNSAGNMDNEISNFEDDFFTFGRGNMRASEHDTVYNPLTATVTHQYHKRYI